jgi:hypothetical protein
VDKFTKKNTEKIIENTMISSKEEKIGLDLQFFHIGDYIMIIKFQLNRIEWNKSLKYHY